jgi:hypothetical protein
MSGVPATFRAAPCRVARRPMVMIMATSGTLTNRIDQLEAASG